MSLFPTPMGVIQRLDKIRRKFMWQGNAEKKVYRLIKWKEVILDKAQGRLGIRNLKNQSRTLNLKWSCRYLQDPQSLWSKVIKSKFEAKDNCITKHVNSVYDMTLWISIRVLWPALKIQVSIRVQNDSRISFWSDNWLGN